MAVVSIRHDFERLGVTLDDAMRRQLPFAAAMALTRTAKDVAKIDLKFAMMRAFDRPTRWTLNSTFVEPATKTKLEANVHFKDQLARGVPAGRFLRPEIQGGTRVLKSHERKIAALGLLPAGMALVPTQHAQMDGSGNMRSAQLAQVVAGLGAGAITQRSGARLRAAAAGVRYFAIVPGQPQRGGLPPAIYVGRGRGKAAKVLPLLVYAGTPHYRSRFDFEGVAMDGFDRRVTGHLTAALDQAMRTARR